MGVCRHNFGIKYRLVHLNLNDKENRRNDGLYSISGGFIMLSEVYKKFAISVYCALFFILRDM